MIRKTVLTSLANAIEKIDETSWSVNNPIDKKRIEEARKNLINVICDNGYELAEHTYRVVKSKNKRELIGKGN